MTKHFFLVLGISLVTLFLNNCSTAHLESQSKSGGVIARDTYLGLGESKAQLEVRAERQCKQYNSNSKAILKFKKYDWASFMEEWYYDCIGETAKNKVQLASMIDVAKDECKVIGYKEGTEKFADCTLKLYSQSVELAAKNNQQIVIQGQSSGSNVMTIYDPVRDSNAAIKRGQGLINGTCTLGDLSNC